MEEEKSLKTTGSVSSLTYSQTDDIAKIERAMVSFGEGYKPNVFDKYNKSMGIEKSVAADAPTFHDIAKGYSEEAIVFWLRYHIADTFAFLGIFDQSSKYQIRQTAELIMQHEIYGQLTLQEFLCFLTRFKRGDYGKIYNSNRPNPQEFLMCLQPFWNEVSYWRGKEEEKRRLDELSHRPGKPTPEEETHIEEIKKRLSAKFGVG